MTPGTDFNPYQFLRFEGFIQAVAEIDPNIFYYLESIQAYGRPNSNHRILAQMAIQGATVITTNFDTRIEEAVGERYMPTFVLSSKRRTPNPVDRLIKLHGSFPWKRGRNVTPRATLTQIGKLGLGFEGFPGLRSWFAAITAQKHLIVIGYSGSDSFDVVPLLENESRANIVTWFSYVVGRSPENIIDITRLQSRGPFPTKRSHDFARHTLDRLAARIDRPCEVRTVEGRAICEFLQRIVNLRGDGYPIGHDEHPAGPRNLDKLRKSLAENPLAAKQRRVILQTLDDGVFGEAYATDVEAKPLRRGRRVTFVESAPSFERGTPEHRATAAFRLGDPDTAFRILEEAARKEHDRDQLLLLLYHFEFRFGEQHGDLRRQARAAKNAGRVSRRSGVLWGLIMCEWMNAFRLDREWRATSEQEPRRALATAILSSSERTIYYGVRAGWGQWYSTVARLGAKHALHLGDVDRAQDLLRNLFQWLDRQTASGIEETAATACALNTLGLQAGRPEIVRTACTVLARLDAKICPTVELLRVASKAEILHSRRQWRQLAEIEQLANDLILKLDPADHWGVKAVFNYLRHSAPGVR
jgi:hypothetical protein